MPELASKSPDGPSSRSVFEHVRRNKIPYLTTLTVLMVFAKWGPARALGGYSAQNNKASLSEFISLQTQSRSRGGNGSDRSPTDQSSQQQS